MLDKITLLSLGIRPDTDPNNPETWSDELKINHKRTLKALGSRSSDVTVKPKGSVSGKSGSFKPQTGKNLETGILSGDDVRQEAERITTALSQIDNSDLEKDKPPRGVNSTIWGTASDKSKKLIREYIKAHREFMARNQKNGQLPNESNLSDSATEDLDTLRNSLEDIQIQLGKEAYERGERHPDPDGEFVVDPTEGKWYQEQTVDSHKEELGKVKSAQLFASSYPLGFTGYERVPMGMDDVDFDNLSAPIKVPNIKLKQASSQDLKKEQEIEEAAKAVKKPGISQDELDDMEELDDAECDTCGQPAIGYDEENGYLCKDCYKDNYAVGGLEDSSEDEEESAPEVNNEHARAMGVIDTELATHGKKSSGAAAVGVLKNNVAATQSSDETDEEAKTRITGLINQELTKHKKNSIMHSSIRRIADKLGYDLSAPAPTVQERNQAETEAGSNISAQITEAGLAPGQSTEESWQSDDPYARDVAVTINGERVPWNEFLTQKKVAVPKIKDSDRPQLSVPTSGQKLMTFDEAVKHPKAVLGYYKWAPERRYDWKTGESFDNEDTRPAEYDMATVNGVTFYNPRTAKPSNAPSTPANWKPESKPTAKVAPTGSIKSEAIPKEQRFASNLRPANIEEQHWNALGDLGNNGQVARGFISMYAHKWHSIKDGEGKYSLDQLKNDRDAIQRFFSGGPASGGNYNGGYFRAYRNLKKEKVSTIESAFGKVPNEGYNPPEVHDALGKDITDTILNAYPMPE